MFGRYCFSFIIHRSSLIIKCKRPAFRVKVCEKQGVIFTVFAGDALARNIYSAYAIRQVARLSILDFRFWILDFSIRLSKIHNPRSIHGDAIVRDFHPLPLRKALISRFDCPPNAVLSQS
jgi:hypothetical protein